MKILIVQTSALGDVIHTLPAFHYLRNRFPDAQIDWVAEKRECELLRTTCPEISNTICFNWREWWNKSHFNKSAREEFRSFIREIRQQKYDLLFDFQGYIKSAIPTGLARAKVKVGFGFKSARERLNCLFTDKHVNYPKGLNLRIQYLQMVSHYFGDEANIKNKKPSLQLSDNEKTRVKTFVEKLSSPIAIVATGSTRTTKNLDVETFLAFLKEVGEQKGYYWIFVWANEKEEIAAHFLQKQFPQNSVVAPRLSFGELGYLMQHSEIVFGMDSFVLHFAEFVGCKTYGFFGPTVGVHAAPIVGPHHNFFQSPCPYGMKFVVRCPKERSCKDVACMRLKRNLPLAKAMAAHFLAHS